MLSREAKREMNQFRGGSPHAPRRVRGVHASQPERRRPTSAHAVLSFFTRLRGLIGDFELGLDVPENKLGAQCAEVIERRISELVVNAP